MSTIIDIQAKEIKDSIGRPTIEVTLTTDIGQFTDAVPAGTSLGATEAKTVPVQRAIEVVKNVLSPALSGMDVSKQSQIDQKMRELDGTSDKSNLGANSILAISLACARAGAAANEIELFEWISRLSGMQKNMPMPMMVMISGGEHGLKNKINIQEFMVVGEPKDGQVIWHGIEKYLNDKKIPFAQGPEGAFAPAMIGDNDAIELVNMHRGNLKIALDIAASHRHSVVDMVNWISKYDLISIEDPFDQEDWDVWAKFTADFGGKIKVVGDDLFTTNPERVRRGINEKTANATIIKPNQIGTLSEVFEVAKMAKQAGWALVVSHRSGETMDDFIADLAVGIGADFLKSGAPNKPERKVKYDRLERIKQVLK